jgi:hypothetical protein
MCDAHSQTGKKFESAFDAGDGDHTRMILRHNWNNAATGFSCKQVPKAVETSWNVPIISTSKQCSHGLFAISPTLTNGNLFLSSLQNMEPVTDSSGWHLRPNCPVLLLQGGLFPIEDSYQNRWKPFFSPQLFRKWECTYESMHHSNTL